MLAIRMQRTGRRGHAMYRVIVQESHLSPTSGRVVAQIGNYDPHAKTASVDKDKASFYLTNGAQPSNRVAILLKKEGVKLPSWVEIIDTKKKSTKKPEKFAKDEAPTEQAAEAPVEDVAADESADKPTEEAKNEPVQEAPAEAPAE